MGGMIRLLKQGAAAWGGCMQCGRGGMQAAEHQGLGSAVGCDELVSQWPYLGLLVVCLLLGWLVWGLILTWP